MATDAVRLSVAWAWRAVRAAEVLALAVLLARFFPRLPCAAAAASNVLRFAASAILHPRFIFLVANAIVILLVFLYRREAASSPPTLSPSSSPECCDSQDQFLPFSAAPLLLPPIAEAPPARRAKEEEEAVFEDKQAVHVTVRAQPPRRSRSEKVGNSGGAKRRAGLPELRRTESANGRWRRSASAAAPEDEEFRREVEEFIAKQLTSFHREETSLVAVTAGDCAPPVATVKLVE